MYFYLFVGIIFILLITILLISIKNKYHAYTEALKYVFKDDAVLSYDKYNGLVFNFPDGRTETYKGSLAKSTIKIFKEYSVNIIGLKY